MKLWCALALVAAFGCGETDDSPASTEDAGDATTDAPAPDCPPNASPGGACLGHDAVCAYPNGFERFTGCVCKQLPNDPGPKWECSDVACPETPPTPGSPCSVFLIQRACSNAGACACESTYPDGPRWFCD